MIKDENSAEVKLTRVEKFTENTIKKLNASIERIKIFRSIWYFIVQMFV
jgi:hypothetical protein